MPREPTRHGRGPLTVRFPFTLVWEEMQSTCVRLSIESSRTAATEGCRVQGGPASEEIFPSVLPHR
jgi:hypothetical protein